MLDQLKNLFVETPMMMLVLDASLVCRQLSRPWQKIIGRETSIENLRIADLFENGSQVFVEHYAKTVLKKNEKFVGLPAKIKGLNGPCTGTLAIWAAEINEIGSAIFISFSPTALRESKFDEEKAGEDRIGEERLGRKSSGGLHSVGTESSAALRIQSERAQQQLSYLRNQIDDEFTPLIGQSNSIRRIKEQVQTVAQTPANVLLVGGLGTGKETVARAIHRASRRATHPFVKVNCASISPAELDRELFGSAGVRSGESQQLGRLKIADGGTLFLEEVAYMSVDVQSKLLEAIQAHETGRPSDPAAVSVDARIIVSNRRDLRLEVSDGHFREDLYCRLSVFQINTPSLEERTEDIIGLTQHFLRVACQELGRPVLIITSQQITQLQSLAWPGNALELKLLVQRAVMLSKGNHLRLDLALPSEALDMPGSRQVSGSDFYTEEEFIQMERRNVLAALKHAGWRISGHGGAAELLGIKPSTLTYRMKKLNIERE